MSELDISTQGVLGENKNILPLDSFRKTSYQIWPISKCDVFHREINKNDPDIVSNAHKLYYHLRASFEIIM